MNSNRGARFCSPTPMCFFDARQDKLKLLAMVPWRVHRNAYIIQSKEASKPDYGRIASTLCRTMRKRKPRATTFLPSPPPHIKPEPLVLPVVAPPTQPETQIQCRSLTVQAYLTIKVQPQKTSLPPSPITKHTEDLHKGYLILNPATPTSLHRMARQVSLPIPSPSLQRSPVNITCLPWLHAKLTKKPHYSKRRS